MLDLTAAVAQVRSADACRPRFERLRGTELHDRPVVTRPRLVHDLARAHARSFNRARARTLARAWSRTFSRVRHGRSTALGALAPAGLRRTPDSTRLASGSREHGRPRSRNQPSSRRKNHPAANAPGTTKSAMRHRAVPRCSPRAWARRAGRIIQARAHSVDYGGDPSPWEKSISSTKSGKSIRGLRLPCFLKIARLRCRSCSVTG